MKHFLVILLILSCVSMQAKPFQFRSALLEQMAHRIQWDESLLGDTCGYYDMGTYKEHPLIVHLDANGVISHIGLRLFYTQMRTYVENPEVLDFLERYFLDIQTQNDYAIAEKMSQDNVSFRHGGMKEVMALNDSVPFSFVTHDRYYEVVWMKNNMPFLSVAFPKRYTLLTGMLQPEIQQYFQNELQEATERVCHEQPDTFGLVQVEDNVYRQTSSWYQLETVNDASYYQMQNGNLFPIFSEERLSQSVANLFQGLVGGKDYSMEIQQSLYGRKKKAFTSTLSQWLNYCDAHRLTSYVAVEEQMNDELKVLVIAEKKDLGYNHMLSVTLPNDFFTNTNAVMKVKLTAYIPTHNVRNLYSEKAK